MKEKTFGRSRDKRYLREVGKRPGLEMIRAQSIIIFKKMIPTTLNILYPFLEPHLLKEDEYYNEGAKELYRLFNLWIERDGSKQVQEKVRKIRDLFCMVVEYDDGYGLPLLDIFSEANIEKFKIKLTPKNLEFMRKRRYAFGGDKKWLDEKWLKNTRQE